MPSRAEIASEFEQARNAQDIIRRKHLKALADYTKRDTILFAARPQTPIVPDDIQGFMAAAHKLKGSELDLILHSTGGSSEAAEQIVMYLRSKYKHIRALVPQSAMSAGTMMACAADAIVMGKQSAIGPIDPQFLTPVGVIPAHAILEEFKRAVKEIKEDPRTAALWVPRLNQLPHGMISTAEATLKRSEEIVERWLREHMHRTAEKATAIAAWLASYEHRSHGKPIGIELAREKGLEIVSLEDDDEFQDKLLSVFHATMLTFDSTACIKMVENQNGKGAYFIAQLTPQAFIPQPAQPITVPQKPPQSGAP